MLYGIFEQYAGDIVVFVFNILLDSIYDQCYPFHAKVFVLRSFWLLLIQ